MSGAELKRWAIAAAFVLVMHTGLMASYLLFASDEPEGSTDSTAMLIDLAPVAVAPSSQEDLAPGPDAVEAMPTPKPPPQAKLEIAEPIEKAEAPSDVTLPLPEPKAEEQKKIEEPDKEKAKTEVEQRTAAVAVAAHHGRAPLRPAGRGGACGAAAMAATPKIAISPSGGSIWSARGCSSRSAIRAAPKASARPER